MFKISCDEIREKFLAYFEEKKHLRISSSSIIPKNDPTLLFINSGMAPLKKYFTGEETPPQSDLCNIQPCIRTIDIDEIGDRHHLTSFEMLGSWSINNYFKKDAIAIAFELLVERFKIPKERLYATVFEGSKELNLEPDYESAKYWEEVGMAKDHIVFSPFEDNFWGPTSDTGPCGPCTEIFFDTGDEYGESYHKTGVFDTKRRYIEIWNAGVFMEFYKNSDGTYDKLKFKSVDTGAGIERLAMALNGLDCIYEVDLIKPIMDEVVNQVKISGGSLTDREIRIITDHMRTATFILSEGVAPSNDGRGYIPRRLLRKCIAIAAKNKLESFNFIDVVKKVIDRYKGYYSHFENNRQKIISMVQKEIEGFQNVLKEGFKRLEKIASGKNFVISGKDAFMLVSTYGIPYELVKEYAEENGGKVDEETYKNEFEIHREISRTGGTSNDGKGNVKLSKKVEDYAVNWSDVPATEFVGYTEDTCEGKVVLLIDPESKKSISAAKQGESVIIAFNRTCFYAESGGQISDIGKIYADGLELEVVDVQKNESAVSLHLCNVVSGKVEKGLNVKLAIDAERRRRIRRNHTAVHILQGVLRSIYGENVKQAGSLVEDDRLRFDFIYDKKLSDAELNIIEIEVNNVIQKNFEVETSEMTMNEAIKSGALALFEEKYGDVVRVVRISDLSKELCGGTHASRTGDLGLFKIVSEGSVGRGIRRISAHTGIEAFEYMNRQINVLREITAKLKASPEDVARKLEVLIESTKQKPKQSTDIKYSKEEIQKKTKKSKNGINYICEKVESFGNEMRDEALRICEVIEGVACFLTEDSDSVKVIVTVNKKITDKVNANKVIKEVLKYFDGKGGGQPHLAQGGGKNTGKINEAIAKFSEFL